MKVIVHCPIAEEDIAALQQKVSEVHAQAVSSYLQSLNCPKDQKLALLEKIKDHC